jgi:multidrug efflux pump subunit AcrA (membrane-fusion protein)
MIAGFVLYQMHIAPVTVPGVAPTRQTVVSEVMGTGTLEARISTTISPKIAGRIGQTLADQGDRVESGQLLVRLDDDELQQQVEIARANLEAAQAAIQRLNADQRRAVAVFEHAKKSHDRVQALKEKNANTQDDVDRAIESLTIATAEATRAEAAISEGQKGLLAAEKTLEYHRARLADTLIKAPFAGLIVARQREAGDITVPGSAVLTLISMEELWISAWVDETMMSQLAVAAACPNYFPITTGAELSGDSRPPGQAGRPGNTRVRRGCRGAGTPRKLGRGATSGGLHRDRPCRERADNSLVDRDSPKREGWRVGGRQGRSALEARHARATGP